MFFKSRQDFAVDTFDPKGKKILLASAHPDDADFCIGGTMIKWLSQGAKGAIVIATNGDKGSDNEARSSAELKQLRHDEQLAASHYLGLEQTWFLDYPDAHLEVTQDLKEKLVRIIREYKPDVVVTFDPCMVYSLNRGFINHPDHRAMAQATLDAVFPMARDFLTFPDHKQAGLAPHKVTDVFLYNFDTPNYYSNTTEYIDRKLELIALHASQVEMVDTKKRVCDSNGKVGAIIGAIYAEAFVHVPIT